MDKDLTQQFSGCVIRTRQRSPYFAVLTSYMIPVQVAEDSDIQTAATDAVHLYINKAFFMGLTLRQRDGLILHEVLHAALGHCWRAGTRIPLIWNIACDYVINLIVRDAGCELPPGGLLDDQYKDRSAEEVYAMLMKDAKVCPKCGMLTVPLTGNGTSDGNGGGEYDCHAGPSDIIPGNKSGKSEDELESAWRAARANAVSVSKLAGVGHNESELVAKMEKSQVDWRRVIWRELSFAPSDYKCYDRRFIGDELFIEGLEPEETLLDGGICCDTSGSTQPVLGKFIAEIMQVHSMYPNTNLELWWQDVALIGPIDWANVRRPQGGGGTDFRPYFEEAKKRGYKITIFLTDGYGTFPEATPDHKVVWVVCTGGLADSGFPFGEVVRILE